MKSLGNIFSMLTEMLQKMHIRGESIKRPTATTEFEPKDLLKPKTTVTARFDMLMSESALIQERISRMAINIAALMSQVDRVAYTQTIAIDKINKLTTDFQNITAELAVMSERLATAENSVNEEEFNALVERLRISTDALSEAAKS
jgi:hypothetical protein